MNVPGGRLLRKKRLAKKRMKYESRVAAVLSRMVNDWAEGMRGFCAEDGILRSIMPPTEVKEEHTHVRKTENEEETDPGPGQGEGEEHRNL